METNRRYNSCMYTVVTAIYPAIETWNYCWATKFRIQNCDRARWLLTYGIRLTRCVGWRFCIVINLKVWDHLFLALPTTFADCHIFKHIFFFFLSYPVQWYIATRSSGRIQFLIWVVTFFIVCGQTLVTRYSFLFLYFFSYFGWN